MKICSAVQKEGSDIWNINHAGGAPVQVSEETAGLLQTALYYCWETDGAAGYHHCAAFHSVEFFLPMP